MGTITRTLTVCLISLVATSCIHRADSLRMLEVRADYEGKGKDEASELKLGDNQVLQETNGGVPVRTTPRTAHVWIFPHETPSKEYFWGGWISVVVEGDRWEVERPSSATNEKPTTMPVKKTNKEKKVGS